MKQEYLILSSVSRKMGIANTTMSLAGWNALMFRRLLKLEMVRSCMHMTRADMVNPAFAAEGVAAVAAGWETLLERRVWREIQHEGG